MKFQFLCSNFFFIHNKIKILIFFFFSWNFQLSIEQIHQYFSRFGGIKSLTVSFNDSSRYVFIVFEHAQSAQASVAIATHRINEKLVNVYLNPSYGSFINIDLPLVPPHQEASTHILNTLPDECLLEIFKFLAAADLSNAADTCIKFRTIAKDTVTNRCPKMDEPTVDGMDARTLARCLRNFGACMTSYVLNCKKMLYGSEQRYLDLFCRHCASVPDNALESLTINNLSDQLLRNFSQPLKQLCSHLKYLKLKECGDVTELLCNCTELTELWMSLVSCPGICDLIFPKLEIFFAYLFNGVLLFTNDSLGRFIRLHRTLKSIRIPLNRQLDTAIIRDIVLNLENLEELTFMDEWPLSRDVAEENFMQLAQLRFLRKLHLNCSRIPLNRFFQTLAGTKTPIDNLSLQSLNLNANVERGLSMMTTVKYLTLTNLKLEGGKLMNILERMPHLKEFHVSSENQIVTIDNIKAIVGMLRESTNLTFFEWPDRNVRMPVVKWIVRAVKRRGNGIKLTIGVRGKWCVNSEMRERMREWVELVTA